MLHSHWTSIALWGDTQWNYNFHLSLTEAVGEWVPILSHHMDVPLTTLNLKFQQHMWVTRPSTDISPFFPQLIFPPFPLPVQGWPFIYSIFILEAAMFPSPNFSNTVVIVIDFIKSLKNNWLKIFIFDSLTTLAKSIY